MFSRSWDAGVRDAGPATAADTAVAAAASDDARSSDASSRLMLAVVQ